MGARCLKNLYFVIRNYDSGVDDVRRCIGPLLKEVETKKALEILNRDFSEPDSVGPSRVALFQYGGPDADLQADVVGFAKELLTKCDRVT
jgi:hypothetical protein